MEMEDDKRRDPDPSDEYERQLEDARHAGDAIGPLFDDDLERQPGSAGLADDEDEEGDGEEGVNRPPRPSRR